MTERNNENAPRSAAAYEKSPDDPHEVTAMYDNLGGLSLGLTYGTPVLDCSCGYSTPTLETWAEVGEHYDQHLADEGLRDDR